LTPHVPTSGVIELEDEDDNVSEDEDDDNNVSEDKDDDEDNNDNVASRG
jgi:hypothetical protein